MIGKYHEVEDFHFIPETEARDIISSYFYFDESKTVFVCKLCSNAQSSRMKTFNHCLMEHLKIFQYLEYWKYLNLLAEVDKVGSVDKVDNMAEIRTSVEMFWLTR